MNAPTLTLLDKAALITVGAGAAGKILLWGLGASLDMAAPPAWMGWVLAGFACLSFVAFDLVLASVVVDARQHGLRRVGVVAVAGAASAAACIALEVAGVVDWPALHAAPAVTMLLYALHLMWPYPQNKTVEPSSTVDEVRAPAPAQLTATTQVNLAVVNQSPPMPRSYPPPRNGFVYVLRSEHGCKIGRAREVSSRVQSIIGFMPFPVELIFTIATEDMIRLENRLHRCFADRRLRGEWFALSANDLDSLLSLDETIAADQIDEVADLLSTIVNAPDAPALPALPVQDDDDIITLKEVRKLSFTEIGERLGISRQAAWQQYRATKVKAETSPDTVRRALAAAELADILNAD